MRSFFCVITCLILFLNAGAKKLNVLFIGNSYTEVNNLPEIVKQLATSMGDTLNYQKSTPGGYTFKQHSDNAATLALIAQGSWDFVVLQEQSQLPALWPSWIEQDMYPYAKELDSLVHVASPCAKTVFYMTWGRKNGDTQFCPQWPAVCTYEGMDSLLQLRYTLLAEMNNAWISPVGKVWRYLRSNNPTVELYSGDGSHPSTAGSYAAALSFYTVLFGKDATPSTYTFGLSATDANAVKNAAKLVAYDSLTTWRQYNTAALAASYTYTNAGNVFSFTSNSSGTQISSYKWNFGDGTPEVTTQNATHNFTSSGTFQVCLTVENPCGEDTYCNSVTSGTVGIDNVGADRGISVYPNPAKDVIQVRNLAADDYDYEIYNAVGRKIKSGRVDAGNNNIDVSVLSNGMYYLHLYSGVSERVSFKWVK